MSYLISLNPMPLKNIAHVGSFKHLESEKCGKVAALGKHDRINTRAPDGANKTHYYYTWFFKH